MIVVAVFGNFILMTLKVVTEDCLSVNCNYAVNKLNISDFYFELLLWWSELRDLVDCEIKIHGKSVF